MCLDVSCIQILVSSYQLVESTGKFITQLYPRRRQIYQLVNRAERTIFLPQDNSGRQKTVFFFFQKILTYNIGNDAPVAILDLFCILIHIPDFQAID